MLLAPMFVTPIAVGLIFRFLLNDQIGAIPHLLRAVGVDYDFFGPGRALFTVALIDVWQWTPFMFVILLAGLTSIPPNLYEASELDGVGGWQAFRLITLPLLAPMMTLAITFRLLDAIRLFDTIFIMTAGGPGTKTYTSSFYLYTVGFTQFHLSQATAGSWMLLVLTAMLVGFLVRRLLRAEPT